MWSLVLSDFFAILYSCDIPFINFFNFGLLNLSASAVYLSVVVQCEAPVPVLAGLSPALRRHALAGGVSITPPRNPATSIPLLPRHLSPVRIPIVLA